MVADNRSAEELKQYFHAELASRLQRKGTHEDMSKAATVMGDYLGVDFSEKEDGDYEGATKVLADDLVTYMEGQEGSISRRVEEDSNLYHDIRAKLPVYDLVDKLGFNIDDEVKQAMKSCYRNRVFGNTQNSYVEFQTKVGDAENVKKRAKIAAKGNQEKLMKAEQSFAKTVSELSKEYKAETLHKIVSDVQAIEDAYFEVQKRDITLRANHMNGFTPAGLQKIIHSHANAA